MYKVLIITSFLAEAESGEVFSKEVPNISTSLRTEILEYEDKDDAIEAVAAFLNVKNLRDGLKVDIIPLFKVS
jgi:hypothetical protein